MYQDQSYIDNNLQQHLNNKIQSNTRESGTTRRKFGKFYAASRKFFLFFFAKSGIHGFVYFSKTFLHYMEHVFWFILVVACFCGTIIISLQSYERYDKKSTVITIEKDHYYWNTSLPSLTICPATNRINRTKFDNYCLDNNIDPELQDEFFLFMVQLANASYSNFDTIKLFPNVYKLGIKPNDYMKMIYLMTEDLTRINAGEHTVRVVYNSELIRCEQVLTENGICYMANNYLAENLSTSFLITGVPPKPHSKEPFYKDKNIINVLAGNLFDGALGYNFVGFNDSIMVFMHSPFETINIAKQSFYSRYALEYQSYSREIVADDDFQYEATIERRGCRFRSESNLTHFKTYTRMLCIQECRLELVFELCQCIPHFYPNLVPNPKRVCYYLELVSCVWKHKDYILLFHNNNGQSKHCDCLQNCVAASIFIDGVHEMEGSTELLGTIGGIVNVKQYPLIRYKRRVFFTFADLLVSIGGTAGLFLGFCVLGAIEIVYFFTLRLFWHIRGRIIED